MKVLLIVSAAIVASSAAFADPHPDAKRVLAVGGAVTEIVYALGQQDRLAGRDTTSTFPPEAMALPDVGYMRQLSPEGVLSVRPDLILAEEGAGPPEALDVLKGADIAFEAIPKGSEADGVAEKIHAVADALGVPEAADAPIAALNADLAELARATAGIKHPKRVLFVLSAQGGRILASGQGTEADAVIRMAGAVNAVDAYQGYKPLTDEAIAAAAPDVILTMDRGDGSALAETQAAQILALPAIALTPAGQAGKVIRMNGLYLLGFGPRIGRAALDLNHEIYGVASGRG